MGATPENVDVFGCLACDQRRAILRYLDVEPLCVFELCDRLGLRQQAVSHHLKVLVLRGMAEYLRVGRRNYYYLTVLGNRAVRVIDFAHAGPAKDQDRDSPTRGVGQG